MPLFGFLKEILKDSCNSLLQWTLQGLDDPQCAQNSALRQLDLSQTRRTTSPEFRKDFDLTLADSGPWRSPGGLFTHGYTESLVELGCRLEGGGAAWGTSETMLGSRTLSSGWISGPSPAFSQSKSVAPWSCFFSQSGLANIQWRESAESLTHRGLRLKAWSCSEGSIRQFLQSERTFPQGSGDAHL